MSLLSNGIKRFPALLTLLASLFTVACNPSNQKRSAPLLVAAASDLVKVSVPLGTAFERSFGAKLTFSFGPSGQLEQQIRHGAPYDVYLPAARTYGESLHRDGLVEGEVLVYALGRLVAWSKTLSLSSLDDLREERVGRIALANPQYAPYGLAAQQALQSAGLWQILQPKLIYAESVSHAFQMAETGNADVALTALALVRDSDRPFLVLNQKLYAPIEQAAVVLRSSPNPQTAKAFQEFLRGEEARNILAAYGFGHP